MNGLEQKGAAGARIPAVCYGGMADGQRVECDAVEETILVRVHRGGSLHEVHSYRFANRTARGRWVFEWERCVGQQGGFFGKGDFA